MFCCKVLTGFDISAILYYTIKNELYLVFCPLVVLSNTPPCCFERKLGKSSWFAL